MEELRRLDPNYCPIPSTAVEAVRAFHKTTGGWSSGMWDSTPELLIKLAKNLPEKEIALFERWVMNPQAIKECDLHPEVVPFPALPNLPHEEHEKLPEPYAVSDR